MSDDATSSEQWREIPDNPGYEASTLGRIRNGATTKILAQTQVEGGYMVTMIMKKSLQCIV